MFLGGGVACGQCTSTLFPSSSIRQVCEAVGPFLGGRSSQRLAGPESARGRVVQQRDARKELVTCCNLGVQLSAIHLSNERVCW